MGYTPSTSAIHYSFYFNIRLCLFSLFQLTLNCQPRKNKTKIQHTSPAVTLIKNKENQKNQMTLKAWGLYRKVITNARFCLS